jgi:hypothetical protein
MDTNKTILDVETDIWAVNRELKIIKSYIADDKSIKMDIEFAKIKLLEKKFYLLAELRSLLRSE